MYKDISSNLQPGEIPDWGECLLDLVSDDLTVFLICQLLVELPRVRGRIPVGRTLLKEGAAWPNRGILALWCGAQVILDC